VRVAYCTPMGVERDGIGVYSRELYVHLSKLCELKPFPLDKEVHGRRHFREMARAINRCDLLHLEHSSNFFKIPFFPLREGYRDLLRRVTVPRLAVYHEPVERTPVYRSRGAVTLPGRAIEFAAYAGRWLSRPVADAWMIPSYNREIFSLPECLVVHTRFHADLVRRFAPGARITVRPLPVSVPLDRSLSPIPPISIPFSSRDIVLTIFGFMERRKDYLGVLEALMRLPPEYKLLIAGGCHDERERDSPESLCGKIMNFVQRNGMTDRVHVTGFFPEGAMPDLIEATTAVVAPFRESHSSASINIGIAYSRPVFAYRTRLTEEMNRNGAGILEVEGAEELVRFMRTHANVPGYFEGAVEAGSVYRSRYGFPAVAAQFVRWYEEMLGNRGKPVAA
jgi:hypothetical protein